MKLSLKKILYSLILLGSLNISAQDKVDFIVESTSYFQFHINYWINLHHYLYQKAEGGQVRKLEQDGNMLIDIGESEVYNSLSDEDKEKMEIAVEYYKKHLIDKDLIRDLGGVRIWLQDQDSEVIKDTLYTEQYTSILNSASKVYMKSLWPLHKAQNQKVIDSGIALLRDMERPLIPKMEKIALTMWPLNTKVRVDLTAYANYAGGYTPTRPRMNIFMSTLDPGSELSFVETITHEGCHLLFRYGGIWRQTISDVFDEQKLEMPYPMHLWHASQFYLGGRAYIEELNSMGISDYVMLMEDKNIFSAYRTYEMFAIWDMYYENELTLTEAITKLLFAIKEKSKG